MINYLALIVALALSAVAAYYSIIGLTTIFASAFIPIVIMGSTLEAAKIVAISWVYRNWQTASRLVKYYLVTAIVILMLITSMGTFGYLSKAHMDQAIPTGNVQDKINLIDEKIKGERETIDAYRKALKQMDEAVDQTLSRTDDEKGATKASSLRKSQQKERAALAEGISKSQSNIIGLQEQRAPVSAEIRKITAEVGPIKYIAELIYGVADDALLDKAVRWVIILIVMVFDPMAVVMLLAANQGMATKEVPVKERVNKPAVKTFTRTPKWVSKTSDLIKRRKSGKLEIDKNSIVEIK